MSRQVFVALLLIILTSCYAMADGVQQGSSKEAIDARFLQLLMVKSLKFVKGQENPVCKDVLANINLLSNPAYARGEWPVLLGLVSLNGYQLICQRIDT